MRYLFLAILLIIIATDVSACSCGRRPGRYFLSKVDKFDVIVIGRINTPENGFNRNLRIEKIYKGSPESEVLEISNGGMCDNYQTYEDGTLVILGLSRDSKHPKRLSTYGCITTSILVKEGYASTLQHQFPLFGNPRIGIIKRKMKLKNLERRIARKIWWNKLLH